MTLTEIDREIERCQQAIANARLLQTAKERELDALYRQRRALLVRPVA